MIFEVEHNYYGQHIGKTDAYHLEEFNKGLYGLAIVYPLALTFSKLSLLALYWRIFRVTNARRPLQIVAALNIAWMIAAVSDTCCFPSNKSATDQIISFLLAFSAVRLFKVSGTQRSKADASSTRNSSLRMSLLQLFWTWWFCSCPCISFPTFSNPFHKGFPSVVHFF